MFVSLYVAKMTEYNAVQTYLVPDKRDLSRINQFAVAILTAGLGIANSLIRSLDECIIGLVVRRKKPFKLSLMYLVAAAVQGIAIPLIGLCELISPELGEHVGKKFTKVEAELFDREYIKEDFINAFDSVCYPCTDLFTHTQAAICSPIRGFLAGIGFVAKTVHAIGLLLLVLPTFDKPTIQNYFFEVCLKASWIAVAPYLGVVGLFDNDKMEALAIDVLS